MSQPAAGSRRKGLLSRDDYLAPPHIPTGQPPKDVLNTIWRKNEVFLDIGSYSIGSFVMMIWPLLLILYFFVPMPRESSSELVLAAYWLIVFCFGFFPILTLLYILYSASSPHTLQPPASRSLRTTEGWQLLDRSLGTGDCRRHCRFLGWPAWQDHPGHAGGRFHQP